MSSARERVLNASEKLFAERGYQSVKVQDIAQELGMHHSSLYHHLPKGKGKEQLYIEVMERHFARHAEGIQQAIDAGDGNLRGQLQRVAGWFLSQPPMNMTRMTQSDIPALEDQDAGERLVNLAYASVMLPIQAIFDAAEARGEVRHANLGNVVGGILSVIEGLHAIPDEYVDESRQKMANELIDVFLKGIKPE